MEKENEVKNQIEQKVDFSHKREDVDYWGEQIAKVVKDPRNIAVRIAEEQRRQK